MARPYDRSYVSGVTKRDRETLRALYSFEPGEIVVRSSVQSMTGEVVGER
jgi:hypothetical protein